MGHDTVRREVEDHVGVVTLDRPAAMNTFSTALATDLDDALWAFEERTDVRAIVIEGAGEAFSAGVDVTEHEEHDTEAEFEAWVATMEEPFRTLHAMGTPAIAAAHGHAVANGFGLVEACDLAVLAEGTELGMTAPKVGLFCMGPAIPLRRSTTEKRALELLLTGELIDAETAVEWGLANRLVPPADLHEAAMDLAGSITDKSPTAVQHGKRAYYETADMGFDEALDRMNEAFAGVCTTADAAEGIAAFQEGRPPAWQDAEEDYQN